ncbi:non-ribosomal peptide synthetase [Paenibacillus paeoniae]|uniref:Amino acid adenylation domain-containing protein n=1 Tax=Paenibacillus paeoniae TaxID=2292705 RepID=A0A371PFV7_9BACL|nr:non-ribosomal peptide synthetase [Paenibacillus paeoniae]REK74754.1 amino acid adenylation domain-containing protein [Paenibacillus paeoniae]
MKTNAIESIYSLSPTQEGMLFHSVMEPDSQVYIQQMIFAVRGRCDRDMLEESLNLLIQKHDILRTSFIHDRVQKPRQVLLKERRTAVPAVDLRGMSSEEAEAGADQYALNDRERGFDLAKDVLIRAALLQLGADRFRIVLCHHHIVMDGWCIQLILDDLFGFYRELAAGRRIAITPSVPYSEYIHWLGTRSADDALDYWDSYLDGFDQSSGIPMLELSPVHHREYEQSHWQFVWSEESTDNLVRLARTHQVTINHVLQAIWGVLLQKYNDTRDVVFGSVVSGRPTDIAGIEHMIGLFINTIPVRVKSDQGMTFLDLLDRVRKGSVASEQFDYASLADIQDLSALKQQLLDHIYIFQNYPLELDTAEQSALSGLSFTVDDIQTYEQTNYDLNIMIALHKQITVRLIYNRHVYKERQMKAIESHMTAIMNQIMTNPNIAVERIELLTAEESEWLKAWNAGAMADLSLSRLVHKQFEEMADRHPDKLAVIFEGKSVTYRQLDEESNRIAAFFDERKGEPGEGPVGLWLEGSVHVLAAMLGCLKAGVPYIPIDPLFPEERVASIIEDSGMELMISSKSNIKSLNRLQWQCPSLHSYLCLDSLHIYDEQERVNNELMERELWEHVGAEAADDISGGGWLSSYTGEPLGEEEMEEFSVNAFQKLQPYLRMDSRVLEIGCATGLTMFRIAPHVGSYVGTDMSAATIERTRRKARELSLSQIELHTLAAHEIGQLQGQRFDIVILNSVIQYFHGHQYFRGVLELVIGLMKDEGVILVGDVMDMDKKPELLASLREYKQQYPQARTKLDYSEELFLPRAYFTDLVHSLTGLRSARCSNKIHSIGNELTRFRYDVLLDINFKADKEIEGSRHKWQYDRNAIAPYSAQRVHRPIASDQLAYIIYTSGSTGKPKGVMIEQQPLSRFLASMVQALPIEDQEAILCLTTPAFDIFTVESLLPLAYGMTVIVANQEERYDAQALNRLLQAHPVTMAQMTPTRIHALLQEGANDWMLRLELLCIGGEPFPHSLLHGIRKHTTAKVYNMYGPTETTVWSTSRLLDDEKEQRYISIGRPLAGETAYIVDASGNLQPPGIVGELYIGGTGLARGYVNMPELTSEKFVSLPAAGERAYATGDLARWREDGLLECLGRKDHQVKVRGYRIELDEIEGKLRKMSELQEAAVLAHKDEAGETELYAYVVAKGEWQPLEWREALRKELPDYMLPTHFVRLDAMPTTVSGKLDRKALPGPDGRGNQAVDYAAPETEMEEQLAHIWQQVLQVWPLGIDHSFFDCGGHSLKAMRVVSRIHQTMNRAIPISALFEHSTIRKLARHMEETEQNRALQAEEAELSERKNQPILKASEQAFYPVTSMQKRLYVLSGLEGSSTVYNIPNALLLEGTVESERLSKALAALVRRHDILRTALVMHEGEPVQVIQEDAELALEEVAGKGRSAEEHIRQFLRPFDLSQAPLVRVALVHLGNARSLLLTDMHHSIADGVSMGIWAEELMQQYDGGPERARPRIQYKDYAVWQQEQLAGEAMQAQERYWLSQFAGELPVLELPTDKPRPPLRSFAGDRITFSSGAELGGKLKRLAEETGATLHMLLLAAYNVLLSRYTGQTDIVVGTPVAGRDAPETEGLIGMFVHTLALRNKQEPEQTFRAFVEKVKRNALEAYEHQHYPFEKLVERVQPQRDMSRHALYDVMLVVQNMELPPYRLGDMKVTPYPVEMKVAKADLTLEAWEAEGEIWFTLEYSTVLFERTTMERWSGHLLELLASAAQSPDAKLKDLEVLSEEERMLLLEGFNATEASYPREKTLHALFEEQALRTPGHIAVVHGEERISYVELQERAAKLASDLRSCGIRRKSLVGVLLDRSVGMIVGLLAILKAGGAYVPIDPDYPEERIHYILEDSGASLLLARSGSNLQNVVPAGCNLLELLADGQIGGQNSSASPVWEDVVALQAAAIEAAVDDVNLQSEEDLSDYTGPYDLAYVIYTSGTTGKPKGVMIEHRNVVRLLMNSGNRFDFGDTDRWTMFHSYCFDFSVWEMYGALLYGGSLHIVPKPVAQDPQAMAELLEREGITVLNQTPTAFYPLIQAMSESAARKLALRYVIFGGEALTPSRLKPWRESYPGIKLVNMYGITETTVHVTYRELEEADMEGTASSIGKPLPTLRAYIWSPENDGLAPIGTAGELYIAGEGVARGYLNRAELTAERFLPDPYRPGERMYRTGDLARWLADGTLEYRGRIDDQVKIRGHRIELGEVAAHVQREPGIRGAAVIAIRDASGQQSLAVYYEANEARAQAEWRRILARRLPEYMIPHYFVRVEHLPLTTNGKLDRQALPKPEDSVERDAVYTPPENELEVKLSQIWQEVLGVSRVGRGDRFFDMGGDSIKAIQVSARLYQAGYKMEIRNLFAYPAIQELSRWVQPLRKQEYQGEIVGRAPLTPIQQRFFDMQLARPDYYHQAVVLFRKDGFDPEFTRQVLQKLLEHHDALRMSFQREDDGVMNAWNRSIADTAPVAFETYSCRDDSDVRQTIERAVPDIHGRLRLQDGLLLSAGLFQAADGDHLMISIHHSVVDGVSWRILLEDFNRGYRQKLLLEEIYFDAKTDSYLKWAQSLADYAHSDRLASERDYWQCLQGQQDYQLPVDFESLDESLMGSDQQIVQWNEEDTRLLLTGTNKAYRTEVNDILLAALTAALSEWSGEERFIIHLEGHGREEVLPDVNVTRTVGWFTSLFPFELVLPHNKELSSLVKETKERLRAVPNRGIGYGILRYLAADKIEPAQGDICFNYLGQFDDEGNDEQSVFLWSPHSSGPSLSPEDRKGRTYKIELNGAVREGKLGITVDYCRARFAPDTIKRLCDALQSSLVAIIRHCHARSKPELTPSDLSYSRWSIDQLKDLAESYEHRGELEDISLLSPMQEGLLFHSANHPLSEAYFVQSAFALEGSLNPLWLEESMNEVIRRHQALRTNYCKGDGERLYQLIFQSRDITFRHMDWRGSEEPVVRERLDQYKQEDRTEGFNLACGDLMRVALIRTGEDKHWVVWSFHHIILDGWSMHLVLREWLHIYRSYLKQEQPRLPQPERYTGYLRRFATEELPESAAFWSDYLQGLEQTTVFPQAIQTRMERKAMPKQYGCSLSSSLTESIDREARKLGATANSLMQAAWGVVLQRYNDSRDVVFGSVVSGRPAELLGVENMAGLFINTIPVRMNSRPNQTVREAIMEMQQHHLASQSHDHCPLYTIQSMTALKESLINHLFIFENYPVDQAAAELHDELGFHIQAAELYQPTHYDLNIMVIPDSVYRVQIDYNGHAFTEMMIQQMIGHYTEVLEQFACTSHSDRLLDEVHLLSSEEREQIQAFNEAACLSEPPSETIHEWVEKQAGEHPGRIAVVFEETSMTYHELNEQANGLARMLQARGARPDDLIAIVMTRSAQFIVGLLGIMKSGGAYVPIDPSYPDERIRYMLEDSGACIWIIDHDQADRARGWQAGDAPSVVIDSAELPGWSAAANPDSAAKANHLQHVLYTSGTTGKPKGVQQEHRSLVNLIHYHQEILQMDAGRVMQYASLSFDMCYLEIFYTLCSGGTLYMLEEDKKKKWPAIASFIEQHRLRTVFFPTALFKTMPASLYDPLLGTVRHIGVAGEQLALTPSFIEALQRSDVHLHNQYGPTESHVITNLTLKQGDAITATPGIGSPIANTRIHLLSRSGQHQPVGIPGELYVSGPGIARGYHQLPELTEDRFTMAKSSSGERLYRTGDMARWLGDGTLEYLGRSDDQVKIRGYRVELGEVEAVLMSLPGVSEAFILYTGEDDGDRQLVAYYAAETAIEPSSIRKGMNSLLPDYMVPALYVCLDYLPLTRNGKVDRLALPDPLAMQARDETEATDATAEEIRIRKLWEKVLKRDGIGLAEDFFDLGGHSLLAIRLEIELEKEGLDTEGLNIYKHRTIREMARYLYKANDEQEDSHAVSIHHLVEEPK